MGMGRLRRREVKKGTGSFTLDINVPKDSGVERKAKSAAKIINEC